MTRLALLALRRMPRRLAAVVCGATFTVMIAAPPRRTVVLLPLALHLRASGRGAGHRFSPSP